VIKSILVVCIGNICRSPVAERVLQAALPGITVTSAGLGALVGHSADATATEVAAARGFTLRIHAVMQAA
jgi:protein-tyrosine phosphatase